MRGVREMNGYLRFDWIHCAIHRGSYSVAWTLAEKLANSLYCPDTNSIWPYSSSLVRPVSLTRTIDSLILSVNERDGIYFGLLNSDGIASARGIQSQIHLSECPLADAYLCIYRTESELTLFSTCASCISFRYKYTYNSLSFSWISKKDDGSAEPSLALSCVDIVDDVAEFAGVVDALLHLLLLVLLLLLLLLVLLLLLLLLLPPLLFDLCFFAGEPFLLGAELMDSKLLAKR